MDSLIYGTWSLEYCGIGFVDLAIGDSIGIDFSPRIPLFTVRMVNYTIVVVVYHVAL